VVKTYHKFRLISFLSFDLQTRNPKADVAETVFNCRQYLQKKMNSSGSRMVAKLQVRLPLIIYHTKPHEYSYTPCKNIWSASTGSGNMGVITIDTNYGTQCSQARKTFERHLPNGRQLKFV
jgi:hypothetical protein